MTTLANSTAPNSVSHAQALLQFLAERKATLSPLLILMHDFPDPDALASAFALQYLAQAGFGIEARIAYGGVVGRSENKEMVRLLRIPIHKLRPVWFHRFAAVALVDTQPGFQNNAFPAQLKAALVIDQHPADAPPAADLAMVDPDCGATCVLVAQALLQTGADIPARVATALAYGILTDTLDLYRARRRDVAETYLQILHYEHHGHRRHAPPGSDGPRAAHGARPVAVAKAAEVRRAGRRADDPLRHTAEPAGQRGPPLTWPTHRTGPPRPLASLARLAACSPPTC